MLKKNLRNKKKLCNLCGKTVSAANISRHRRSHAFCGKCGLYASRKKHICFQFSFNCSIDDLIPTDITVGEEFIWIPVKIDKVTMDFLISKGLTNHCPTDVTDSSAAQNEMFSIRIPLQREILPTQNTSGGGADSLQYSLVQSTDITAAAAADAQRRQQQQQQQQGDCDKTPSRVCEWIQWWSTIDCAVCTPPPVGVATVFRASSPSVADIASRRDFPSSYSHTCLENDGTASVGDFVDRYFDTCVSALQVVFENEAEKEHFRNAVMILCSFLKK